MADSNSIVNFGELSKPATVLIEKISDAVGGVFRPYQIRRIAQAEADAEKIRAVSQIEVDGLQRRALHRFLVEEAKKQNNIETITRKALPEVSERATPQNIEDDWITNFFDKCRIISDDEMQTLWAKVLAGEANSPGKFSKRTVNLLAGLDKEDAEMFARLCSFSFVINGTTTLLIYDNRHKIYIDHGVTFDSLSHVESIGLIHFSPLAGYERTGLRQNGYISYHGTPVWIDFGKPELTTMQIGQALLTKAGHELASICSSNPKQGFLDYVKEMWKVFGYKIEPDVGQGTPAAPPPPAIPADG